MNALPDFSTHGYQIEQELGHNNLGGRVTYLATEINSQKSVVIKQFQFAQLGATWAEYSAYEQEIQVLKKIAHPGIPRYLDDFQTDSGFCMVQEYINAASACDSLRDSFASRTFSPPDIKQIAIATLKILAYLQSQKPPVIHRDIKPENLLIDDNLNVYLVDFGFARIGGGNIAASSVVKGTMGFMPPEQMFNRELTKASDLYGLGITLICLLTGTKSADVGNLIDANYGIHFRHLVPPLQQGWMNWLEKMVAPRIQDRYQSAAEALTALKSLDVKVLPKLRVEGDRLLKFTATEYGESLTQTVTISNPIPDTILTGRWEVAPHPNDPPHTPYDHSWISFEPQAFESNNIECTIAVDTQKLLANRTYKRQIILRANSEPETHTIEVKVTTASLPVPQIITSFSALRLAFMCCFILAGFMFYPVAFASSFGYQSVMSIVIVAIALYGFAVAELGIVAKLKEVEFNWFGSFGGGVMGFMLSLVLVFFWMINLGFLLATNNTIYYLILSFAAGIISPIALALFGALRGGSTNDVAGHVIWLFLLFGLGSSLEGLAPVILMSVSAVAVCGIVQLIFNQVISEQIKRKIFKLDAAKITFLTAGFCTSLGVAFRLFLRLPEQLQWVEPVEILVVGGMIMTSLAVTAIPLLDSIVFKPKRILAKYRKSKPTLVKP